MKSTISAAEPPVTGRFGSPGTAAVLSSPQEDMEGANRPVILVVDDEAAVAMVLSRGLTYAGYDATIATSGQEALDRLAEKPFDVLLTDIHMPRLRGDEMQRIARERDPDLAVLLITAANETSSAIECLKEGVYDYLLKPFDLADVVVRVGNALERRRLVRENRDYQQNLERRVAAQAERLNRTMQGSLEMLIAALEAKDSNTRDHSARVAKIASHIALRLLPHNREFAARVRVAALFHDIGKIGIPESLLTKDSPLTETERDTVRQHPLIGETILAPLLEEETVAMVRSHHEQINGGGYPDGFKGSAIPLGGRIIAVADSYDAMTSPRPYRSQIAVPDVLEQLKQGAGEQWDADAVGVLLALADEGVLPLRGEGAIPGKGSDIFRASDWKLEAV
ncbi:MAG: response regulator [Cytophagales bacterium]|nr:response regulator [Armatimonadota bacterium]